MFKNLKRWWIYDSPPAATSKGWDDHHRDFKENAPLRYFFNETLSDVWCKYWLWPVWNPIRDRYYKMYNRFAPHRQYSIVKTDLDRGEYYDKDTLMLHANFAILVDFVEVEKAWMEYICHSDKYPKIHFWQKPFFRNREMGMTYLNWECDLDDPTSPNYSIQSNQKPWDKGHPSQAEAARQTKRLYLWWKDDYSKRKDPWETKLPGNEITKIEEKNIKEEQEALEMLIRIRKSLWT
jgi:hypothetical protein